MCLGIQIKGHTVSYSIRRLVWWLERGEELRHSVTLMATCGNQRCVNPDHMKKVSKGTRLAQLDPPKARRRREPLYLMAWLAGFDLQMLPNGRYKVVKVEKE